MFVFAEPYLFKITQYVFLKQEPLRPGSTQASIIEDNYTKPEAAKVAQLLEENVICPNFAEKND